MILLLGTIRIDKWHICHLGLTNKCSETLQKSVSPPVCMDERHLSRQTASGATKTVCDSK